MPSPFGTYDRGVKCLGSLISHHFENQEFWFTELVFQLGHVAQLDLHIQNEVFNFVSCCIDDRIVTCRTANTS